MNENVKILVDADACPVVTIVELIAQKYQIPVILLCDTNHVLESSYSQVVTVGAGTDAVDFKLVSICKRYCRDSGLWRGCYDSRKRCLWYSSEWKMVHK